MEDTKPQITEKYVESVQLRPILENLTCILAVK